MKKKNDIIAREKAVSEGIEYLTDAELLAVILRTGSKDESVLALAKRLLTEIDGIGHLKDTNYHTLIQISGIKEAKAVSLLACLEIGRRVSRSELSNFFYDEPYHVYLFLKERVMHLKQEHFMILILDNKLRLIRMKTLFIGSINMSVVSIREVFIEALSVNGVCIICAHNHPSGDASPSPEDIDMTHKLMEAGSLMGIDVLDHVIVGWNQYYSFKAQKIYRDPS